MHDLQAIIDGLPGIYLIVAADAEYTMVASSDERLRVTMTRREDVIGKPLFEVFSDHEPEKPSSGAATLRRSLEDVIATGQTQRLGARCVMSPGAPKPVAAGSRSASGT